MRIRALVLVAGLALALTPLAPANAGPTPERVSAASVLGGATDSDGDGVVDALDVCPAIAGSSMGCPIAQRTMTLKYARGAFKGSVGPGACGDNVQVLILKVRKGPDRQVSGGTTTDLGAFRFTKSVRPGRYYATTDQLFAAGFADCLAGRSATITRH